MHMSWHVATHHWMLASLLLRYVVRRDTHTGYVVVQGYPVLPTYVLPLGTQDVAAQHPERILLCTLISAQPHSASCTGITRCGHEGYNPRPICT